VAASVVKKDAVRTQWVYSCELWPGPPTHPFVR